MNIETRTRMKRVRGRVLGLALALLGGCGLPPTEDGQPGEAEAAAVHEPPPCRDGRPVTVHDAVWRCDARGTWQLISLEEWVCTDAERRQLIRVSRPHVIGTGGTCTLEPPTP